MSKRHKFTINDLPKFSKWPGRLLGIEPWKQRVKSKEEIDREYELESWGAYLKRIKDEGLQNEITIKTLDNWQGDANTQILYTKNDRFIQDTFGKAYSDFLRTVKKYIIKYLPAGSIVELGAGYGSVILSLAKEDELKNEKFLAAEYTPSGVELIKWCARNQKTEIIVDNCDFLKKEITNLLIPEGSILFTCASACTLPELPKRFVDSLVCFKPKVVIHYEPIYEHHNENNLLNMMRRRYVEVNDYNRNLLTLLKEHEQNNSIQILIEDPAVIGVNPLFPISVIAWKPK